MNRSKCDSSKVSELLKWWPQQQVQLSKQQADLIRNNVLQQVLAIRHDLERVCEHTENQQGLGGESPRERFCLHHLKKLEDLYTSLEQLSDRLDSPYLRDSLPLALCHHADSWEQFLHLRTDFPPSWESGSVIHTQLLLTFVNTLCALLTTADQLPRDCGITLKQDEHVKEFTFYAIYCDALPPTLAKEAAATLMPILKTLQLVVSGSYVIDAQSREINWILSWPV